MTFKDPYLHRSDRHVSTQLPDSEVGQERAAHYPSRGMPFNATVPSGEATWSKRRKVSLTSREIQILGLLATGLPYKEIARRAFLSKDTVKYHCKNLYMKLRARSRTEALVAAAQTGLLQEWYLHPDSRPASEEGCV